jgi:anti-repressor protein
VDDTNMTISARDLHDALGIQKRFSAWFEANAKDFVEGEDFTSVPTSTVVNNGASRELEDYQLTVDMAKHLCLMSHTEKGRECRQYLIDLEKAWNTPEQIMARALRMADKTIASLRDQVKQISAQNEEMKPKALFADAVATADTSILIGDLAKLIRQNGYDIGQNRLFGWLRDNGYLVKHGDAYNMPTQKSMDLGLFEVKERTIGNPDGSTRITRTTKVTGKGQQYFINKFLGGAKCSAT